MHKGETDGENYIARTLIDLRRSINKHKHELLKKHRAEAIGIGYKYVEHKRTSKIAIVFFVKRKMSSYELRRAGIQPIPKSLFGYPTDVREVGKIRKY